MDAPSLDPAAAEPIPVPPADAAGPAGKVNGVSALVADVRQLASDAKTLAEAELAYQASRAKVVGASARNVAAYGVAAFVLAFFALGALTVGLLLALTPLVTAWGATGIVAGALALAAFACVSAATGRIKRLGQILSGNDREKAP